MASNVMNDQSFQVIPENDTIHIVAGTLSSVATTYKYFKPQGYPRPSRHELDSQDHLYMMNPFKPLNWWN
jgi:hypothetical protein